MNEEKNPYYKYEGLFCKVVIRKLDNRVNKYIEKPLKGIVECIGSDIISVVGDYQMTTVPITEIILCTAKPPR